GAGAARNAGIQATTGEILGFLDADDVWTPNSLSLRLAALDGHDAAYGAVEEFVDPDFEGNHPAPRSLGPARMAGTMLITRRAWTTTGPIEESLSVGEFIDWVARFETAGLSAARIDDVVLRRRIHATNTTRGAEAIISTNFLEVARLHRRRQDS
ncbi:MAG: glycosyltransferase, partial [Rhodoglobus sp.]|nr:glycosyltransferase [Rhodoglobus sp.]